MTGLAVLVATGAPVADRAGLEAVLRRYRPRLVLAPSGSAVPGARAAPEGTVITAGTWEVVVVAADPLVVAVQRAPP